MKDASRPTDKTLLNDASLETIVGVVNVPVNVGESIFAFKLSAVSVAVDTGLFASDVLSTFPSPTVLLVIPETAPINVVYPATYSFELNETSPAINKLPLRAIKSPPLISTNP